MPVTSLCRTARAVIVATALILLSACSRTPSVADARKAFEDRWEHKIKNGDFEIVSFKKLDAQPQEIFGVKYYTLEYEVEVRHLRDLIHRTELLEYVAGPFDKSHRKGEIQRVRGVVTFTRTEKGWRANSIQPGL